MAEQKGNLHETSIEPEKNSKVILAEDFEPAKVDQTFRDFFKDVPEDDEESRLYYFTEPHVGSKERMGLFGDFAPSVVFAANNFNGLNLPFREKYLKEFGYSKLCHLYCTLDKSVMFSFFNRYMARSKVFNINSAAMILGEPDLQINPEKLKNEDITDDEIVGILFEVKKNATKLMKKVQVDYDEIHQIEESSHELGYPSMLEKLVGEKTLTRILLYGSSAKGAGNDFDNFAILKQLPENLYQKIRNSRPNENGKEVGVIFVPERILQNFLYVNVSNTLFRENAKSLKGNFEIPIESQRYRIFKEMYHAGFGSAKLLSGMNLVYRKPEIFFDKPGLFEYFMKLNRFTLQGLSQNKGYVTLTKEETLQRLRDEFGFEVPKFKADASYLQECFLRANKASVELARKLYDSSLAREEREELLQVNREIDRKICECGDNRNKIYVFRGEEPLKKGDIIPVKVLERGDVGYESRRRDIRYKEINGKNFRIGKRM